MNEQTNFRDMSLLDFLQNELQLQLTPEQLRMIKMYQEIQELHRPIPFTTVPVHQNHPNWYTGDWYTGSNIRESGVTTLDNSGLTITGTLTGLSNDRSMCDEVRIR